MISKRRILSPSKKKCHPDWTGLMLFPKVVDDDRAQFTCSIYSERRMGQRGETAPITARKKSVPQFSFRRPLAAPSRGSSLSALPLALEESPLVQQTELSRASVLARFFTHFSIKALCDPVFPIHPLLR